MKETMSQHEKNLDGIKEYLSSYGSWLETLKCGYGQNQFWIENLKEKYTRERKDYAFYLHQFECALRAKKKGFDRFKYLMQ